MVAKYPKVQVYKKDNPIVQKPGIMGKVAVIGAFDSNITDPVYYNDIDKAYVDLGTDKTYNGVDVLPELFYGANGILAVNITSKNGETVEKSITVDKLVTALSKIKYEKFDVLFIAELLTDEFLPIIKSFLDERLKNKLPTGLTGAVNRNNLAGYTATSKLFGDYSYGIITQQFTIDGTVLSLLKSSAFWTGVICDLNVGKSMTKKIMPLLEGVTPELVFEPVNEGFNGLNLLQLGYTTFECFDRENDLFVCVNSEQFNGYDLYINRVRDYVLKEMSLHNFLGDRNRAKTLPEIEHELDRVKQVCVGTLDLLEDIEYNVSKSDVNCVDVNITRLVFAGIITEIDVYFTIEVQ